MAADRQSDEMSRVPWDFKPWFRDLGSFVCAAAFVCVCLFILGFVVFASKT